MMKTYTPMVKTYNLGSRPSFLLIIPGTSSQINLDLDLCKFGTC
jgi:hypothetical protein